MIIDTTTDHITPCSRMRARGNYKVGSLHIILFQSKWTLNTLVRLCNRGGGGGGGGGGGDGGSLT